MKQEIYFKAQQLDNDISDIQRAIKAVEENKGNGNLPAFNFTICSHVQFEAMQANVLRYLKNRLKSLQTEFDNLK